MYKNQKLGVAVLTYNRQENFIKLLDQISKCEDVDLITVVKNGMIPYERVRFDLDDDSFTYISIPGKTSIAKCKNTALIQMLDAGCDHMFVLEDDMLIKDFSVFRKYIDAATHFRLGHMNWNTIPTVENNQRMIYVDGEFKLCLTSRLCGCFQYFERKALQHVGLMDERYINLLEHAEHAYRFGLAGYSTPFNAFADIVGGEDCLENVGEESTTIDKGQEYMANMQKAACLFAKTYGKPMYMVPRPSSEHIVEFLKGKLSEK